MFLISVWKTNAQWRSAIILLLLLGLAVVLIGQAYHPAWSGHLSSDVLIHHNQVIKYAQEKSWSNIRFKEYQPGALWFFMVPRWLTGGQDNFEFYRAATIFVNSILILMHAWLFHRWGPRGANWLLGGMLLAMGPLLLYRFDLIVSLLVLGAWLLATGKHWHWSGLVMGLAVVTKLYPIVLLPVLVAERWRDKKLAGVLQYLVWFGVGIALLAVPFLMWGGSLADIADSLDAYKVKPVEFSSLWANFLTIEQMMLGGGQLVIDGAHGVQGIAEVSAVFPLQFYNFYWVVPTGFVLIAILWYWRGRSYLHPIIPIIVLTVFTLSAKVLNPQYLWWFLAWLPLLPLKLWPKRTRRNLITVVLASLILTQIIYPLRYYDLLNWYYGYSSDGGIFVLLLMRNSLLVIWLLMLINRAQRTSKLPLAQEGV